MTDQSGTSGDNHGSPANNTDNSSASMKWNRNHSAIRRIMAELRDLERNPSPDFRVHTFESNLFEIHFTVRGPEDTDFAGGVYHGRIILPENYPYKAPDIVLMTVAYQMRHVSIRGHVFSVLLPPPPPLLQPLSLSL